MATSTRSSSASTTSAAWPGIDLTEETVGLVARALGTQVRDAGGTRGGAGARRAALQPRPSTGAAVAGLTATGCDVVDVGRGADAAASTSPPRRSTVDGLCMITGSHNPPEYNGMKIGVGKTTLYGEAIQEILRMVAAGRVRHAAQGKVTQHDIVTPYQDYVAKNLQLGPPQAQGGGRRRQRHRRRSPCPSSSGSASRWCRSSSSRTAASPTTTPTRRWRRTSST